MERVERFRRARRDTTLAVLEGFQALKHALRFGADVLEVVTSTEGSPEELAASLAPDVRGRLVSLLERVSPERFADLSPQPHPTGIMALARRPPTDPEAILADPQPDPIVLLEAPRRLENVGAAIRVAAAANVAAVLTTGEADPWHPVALRGSAGLHFALPVARLAGPLRTDRPIVALDPEGKALRPGDILPRAVVAFGTERRGLSADLRRRADALVRIPMREGVSSLNLATAVAVTLYVSVLDQST
jgi:RNA methyltransferase, TrmH family